jgi:Prokaryotic RING finger family 1
MSTQERSRPEARTLRCPFCHDGLDEAAADLVTCAACGGPHHAECFLEGEGCAGTGCAQVAAQVRTEGADATLTLSELRDYLRDPTTLPARDGWLSGLGLGVATLAMIWVLVKVGTDHTVGADLAWIAVGAAVWFSSMAIWRLTRPAPPGSHPRVVRTPGGGEFDPFLGVWHGGLWVPGTNLGPGAELLERLREQAPQFDGSPGSLAAECPACKAQLQADDDPDAQAAFCHHCGELLSPTATEEEL